MSGLRVVRRRVAPAAMLVIVMVLLAAQQGLIITSAAAPRRVGPWPVAPPRHATVELGVTTIALARNYLIPWTPVNLSTVDSLEYAVHLRARVVMWYADWRHDGPPSLLQLRAVSDRGSIPEITWEPWDASRGLYAPQPEFALRTIVAGQHDAYISAWARRIAAWKGPVRIRFAQEFNGNWYPWGHGVDGNTARDFVRAWRHVHRIFDELGATNVQWVWSPVTGAPRAYFPGRGEVDRLGITCLNGGSRLFQGVWRSFARICGGSIRALHRLAPRLPIELSEVGSAEVGGNKAAWLTGMFAYLAHHPEVKTLVFFNLHKEADWGVTSSRAVQRAARSGLDSGRYS